MFQLLNQRLHSIQKWQSVAQCSLQLHMSELAGIGRNCRPGKKGNNYKLMKLQWRTCIKGDARWADEKNLSFCINIIMWSSSTQLLTIQNTTTKPMFTTSIFYGIKSFLNAIKCYWIRKQATISNCWEVILFYARHYNYWEQYDYY